MKYEGTISLVWLYNQTYFTALRPVKIAIALTRPYSGLHSLGVDFHGPSAAPPFIAHPIYLSYPRYREIMHS
jgi:hypothetical protein